MSETVTIGDREFRIGAWYGSRRCAVRRRRFLAVRCSTHTYVEYQARNGETYAIAPQSWTKWAGEEIKT